MRDGNRTSWTMLCGIRLRRSPCACNVRKAVFGEAGRDTSWGAAALSLVLVLGLALGAEGAAKKYIFTSWDLGESKPEQILKCADLFDKTGCDGVGINMDIALPGCRAGGRTRKVTAAPAWTQEEARQFEPTLKAIAKHPSLRSSMLYVTTSPEKRLGWSDDAAWASFAQSMGVLARLAKTCGLPGLITDFEDYWKQNQYLFLRAEDGDYRKAWALARRRGAEVFGAVFREYPEVVVLSFQLLASEAEYGRSDDPRAVMLEKEDLFPAFVNGIFDVIPPEARIVDGCEGLGYHGEASCCDFYKTAKAQLIGALPLVAKENHAKYRAQLSVGFGLYMDSYIFPTNSPYYFGPVRGKRINHFEDNLRQATECCDEYIWFWGEHGFWIDWPKSIRDWGAETKPWNEMLDGNFDLMCRGVKDPHRCVREERARQQAVGRFANLVPAMPKANEKGEILYRTVRVETDGWYGVRVLGRGEALWGKAYFHRDGNWRYDLGAFRMVFAKPDKSGWREGTALVRIPDGATEIFLILNGTHGREVATTEFKDLEIFRIK